MSAWQWFYTQDEERWNFGGATREETIICGLCEYDGEPFLICRARKSVPVLTLRADELLERLDERNEEILDPDGDGTLFERVTRGQAAHLEYEIGETIRKWAAYWGIMPTTWVFAETEREESIRLGAGYDETARVYYDCRLQAMGRAADFEWSYRG